MACNAWNLTQQLQKASKIKSDAYIARSKTLTEVQLSRAINPANLLKE